MVISTTVIRSIFVVIEILVHAIDDNADQIPIDHV